MPSRFGLEPAQLAGSVAAPGTDLPSALLQRRPDVARANYDEAVANYRKTTLTAYQEVEDNLAALHHLADEVVADEAASKSAASAANHSDKRYDAGVADYIEVTTTHTAALQAQRDTICARVLQLNAAVALVRATGGGWTVERISRP
jgi:outer membrane protein, multidrug efflux system